MKRLIPAITALAISTCALAETYIGRVVGVTDGDTVTVLDASRTEHKVRLSGIDAPEKRQPFGAASKEGLSSSVFGKAVTVEFSKVDRYGREIGKVMVGEVNANLSQVSRGLAWHYKHYEREQSPEERTTYAAVEARARRDRVGVWSQDGAIPPWDFRKSVREERR